MASKRNGNGRNQAQWMDDSGLGMNMDVSFSFTLQSPARSVSDISSSGGGGASYKELAGFCEEVDKDCDSLTERICDLNLKLASRAGEMALLIDPELSRFNFKEDESHPDFLRPSQCVQMKTEDVDKKLATVYKEMDNYFWEKERNKNKNGANNTNAK